MEYGEQILKIYVPPIEGQLQRNAPLADKTWFHVGGQAEILARPANTEDLCALLAGLASDVSVTTIGAASNLIVRDGGLPGVVIRLGRGFSAVTMETDGVIAEAACSDIAVAKHASVAGLAGLEFLSGIPGTIGGAVVMNAGAYGGDVAGCLDWVEIVLRSGELVRLSAERLCFNYRSASLPLGSVVVRARFWAVPGNPSMITARMAEIRTRREATQPVRARTGGSTFCNPLNMKAWELIAATGCRGLQRGGAQVSEKHANFMLNIGSASATDLEGLGEEVRQRVFAASGVDLQWEIKRIGRRIE
jgi:UDP-N-acetylmuramate dehydrogenase